MSEVLLLTAAGDRILLQMYLFTAVFIYLFVRKAKIQINIEASAPPPTETTTSRAISPWDLLRPVEALSLRA